MNIDMDVLDHSLQILLWGKCRGEMRGGVGRRLNVTVTRGDGERRVEGGDRSGRGCGDVTPSVTSGRGLGRS